MLVAKFRCPECHAVLKPSAPKPEGKKVKCSKCSCVFTVTSPEPDVEEVEPVAYEKRSSPRASARDEESNGEDDPRPRNRRQRPEKKRGGSSGLKIGLLAGAGVLVLFVLAGVGYLVFRDTPLQAYIGAHDKATAILAGVKDEAGAKDAEASLVAAGHRLRELPEHDASFALYIFSNKEEAKAASEEAMKNPDKARTLTAKIIKANMMTEEAEIKLSVEVLRVGEVPGGKNLLAAFFDAWGPQSVRVKRHNDTFERVRQSTRSIENFKKVQVGMTEQQVLDLLGSPLPNQPSLTPGVKTLVYSGGAVYIKGGKVIERKP